MKQQHNNVVHVQRKRKDRLYPQTILSTSNVSSFVFLAIQGCNNNTFSDLLRPASRIGKQENEEYSLDWIPPITKNNGKIITFGYSNNNTCCVS